MRHTGFVVRSGVTQEKKKEGQTTEGRFPGYKESFVKHQYMIGREGCFTGKKRR